jgi:16S rRNA processing protein RimM
VVAEILRPRGNRGEVVARSLSDIPDRLTTLKRANVRLANGCDMAVEIAEAWVHKQDWVLKFVGVDSIDGAEQFAGSDLWVPLAERAKLPEGEFFRTDLIGFTVTEGSTGKTLGTVAGWQQYGGPPLMEVTVGGKEVLIPFVKPVYRVVDLEGRRIEVDLPEGLLDID